MRPIDADALLKLIKDTNDGYRYGYLDATDIHNAPTLTLDDLREKGKWKESDFIPGMLTCTACGAQRNPKFKIGAGAWNCCPNCGAKMGGGE